MRKLGSIFFFRKRALRAFVYDFKVKSVTRLNYEISMWNWTFDSLLSNSTPKWIENQQKDPQWILKHLYIFNVGNFIYGITSTWHHTELRECLSKKFSLARHNETKIISQSRVVYLLESCQCFSYNANANARIVKTNFWLPQFDFVFVFFLNLFSVSRWIWLWSVFYYCLTLTINW